MENFKIDNGKLIAYTGTDAHVMIPDGVTSICDGAFIENSTLEEIFIPNGVTFIGRNAFRDCVSLKRVTLPDGMLFINGRAFSGCESLTEVTVPESIRLITQRPFSGCDNLERIVIPLEKLRLLRDENPHLIDEEPFDVDYLQTEIVAAGFRGWVSTLGGRALTESEKNTLTELIEEQMITLNDLMIDTPQLLTFAIEKNMISSDFAETHHHKCKNAECRAILLELTTPTKTEDFSSKYGL